MGCPSCHRSEWACGWQWLAASLQTLEMFPRFPSHTWPDPSCTKRRHLSVLSAENKWTCIGCKAVSRTRFPRAQGCRPAIRLQKPRSRGLFAWECGKPQACRPLLKCLMIFKYIYGTHISTWRLVWWPVTYTEGLHASSFNRHGKPRCPNLSFSNKSSFSRGLHRLHAMRTGKWWQWWSSKKWKYFRTWQNTHSD